MKYELDIGLDYESSLSASTAWAELDYRWVALRESDDIRDAAQDLAIDTPRIKGVHEDIVASKLPLAALEGEERDTDWAELPL